MKRWIYVFGCIMLIISLTGCSAIMQSEAVRDTVADTSVKADEAPKKEIQDKETKKTEEASKETTQKKTQEKEPTKTNVEKEEAIVTKKVEEPVMIKNEFFNDLNYAYDLNLVSVKPRHVYWDGETLVAECFVINGFSTTVYNVNINNLEFSNAAGVISSASFGMLQNAAIAPYSYIIWTFHFGPDCIQATDADLTGNLGCRYHTDYQY